MNKRTSQTRRFSTLLRELATAHPKTAVHLSLAQSNREQRLSNLLGGVRLKGYEELIGHLEDLERVFEKSRRLRSISFLVGRARGDFHTALEAALSGFHAVAFDAMRDVMEIEFLFREFYYEPNHIEEWVSCSGKERHDKFQPALPRQRHARRVGKQPQDLAEASDYRGHSMFLHVSPDLNPFGGPGLGDQTEPFADDSCFWEIFEHGRRVLIAAHRLRRKVARHIKSPWGPERGLRRVRDACQATQQMQTVWMALLKVMSESHGENTSPQPDTSDRTPTSP